MHSLSKREEHSVRSSVSPVSYLNLNNVVYKTKPKNPKVVGKYILGDVVGEGSFGKVKEAIHCENLLRVAIKILKNKRIKKLSVGNINVIREIRLLRSISHLHIIKIYEVLQPKDKHKLYLVLEFCICGLQDLLENSCDGRLPLWQAHSYFFQLIEGLEYLHSRGIVHRDIKPGNLLLTNDDLIKITDFGVAEEVDFFDSGIRLLTSSGSPAFQPPEVVKSDQRPSSVFKTDIWAAGVTLYRVVVGKLPFDGLDIYELFGNISRGEYTIPAFIPDHLADLITGLLASDPQKRLSILLIKLHPWVIQVHPHDFPPASLPFGRPGD